MKSPTTIYKCEPKVRRLNSSRTQTELRSPLRALSSLTHTALSQDASYSSRSHNNAEPYQAI